MGLNGVLPSKFWWLGSANHVKFYEKCLRCMKKLFFSKRCFQIGSTWFCHSESESNKMSMIKKLTDSPVKKGSGTGSTHADIVLQHEKLHMY